MGHAYPDAVQALHLNMLPLRRPGPGRSPSARTRARRWPSGRRRRAATRTSRARKPQTLAYGLFDSPVGLMSWIAEKFDAWTDTRGVPRDDVLTTVMIYWVTGTIGTSFWPYYARMHGGLVLDEVIEAATDRARR